MPERSCKGGSIASPTGEVGGGVFFEFSFVGEDQPPEMREGERLTWLADFQAARQSQLFAGIIYSRSGAVSLMNEDRT